MSRTITMMPVAHILKNVKDSLDIRQYGGEVDWFQILAAKVSHAHFDELTDTIMREGFNLPIVLVGNDVEGYTVGNGHHRLSAAILLGLPSIPVIVSEDGDYWAMEDSHDGDWNPGERSFDYWLMLSQNLPSFYAGDCGNEVHRDQFEARSKECDECGYEYCECCGDCETYPCVCNQCGECNTDQDDCRCEVVTPHALHDDEYRYILCQECGLWGYRVRHAACNIPNVWDEAHAENDDRIPAGAWHPDYILSDAYAQHAEWLKDEPMRIALKRWRDIIADMRRAAMNGASEYALNSYAERITEAWSDYMAL